ncbi:MAG: TIM44-like domain-containing protein [Oscillospiraceae bacterium]
MKRFKQFIILCAAVVLLAGSMFPLPAGADAGNFSGNNSYGGGSFSGGSSGGSSYSGGGSWVFIGNGDSGEGGNDAAAIIAAIVIILIISRIVRQNQLNATISRTGPQPQTEREGELAPIETLRESDPNFSPQAFKEKISNLYVQMQDAWQNKDFEPMRPYMTDGLYTQFDRQLDELRKGGRTNYVDRVAVLGVALSGWKRDDNSESVVAIVSARIVDYTLDDKTGKLVSGSKSVEKFMTYEWTLTRSKGSKTAGVSEKETDAKRCPSCGAPLDVNQSARCPYCGSVVFAKDFNWAISSIRGISQRNGR